MASHFEELVALLLISLVSASSAAVVRSATIDNPCQVDPTSTGTAVYLPINEQIQLTISAANTADSMCQLFKEALNTSLTNNETRQLNLPVSDVPGLSLARNDSALTAANIVNSLKQDYREVSIYIMYLQFIQTLVAVDSGKFSEASDLVMNRFYSWLCSIDTILRSQNNPVTQFVNNTVVNENVKLQASGDSKNRYALYYLVMKNAHDFIRNKSLKLDTYLKTLK